MFIEFSHYYVFSLCCCFSCYFSFILFFVCLFVFYFFFFFFSSRRRHTRYIGDWSSDVCSSDLLDPFPFQQGFEFLGNEFRTIVTAETFRCFLHLSQHLFHGLRDCLSFLVRSEERRVGKECRFLLSEYCREVKIVYLALLCTCST